MKLVMLLTEGEGETATSAWVINLTGLLFFGFGLWCVSRFKGIVLHLICIKCCLVAFGQRPVYWGNLKELWPILCGKPFT